MRWLQRRCNHLRVIRRMSPNAIVVRDVCMLCRAELGREFNGHRLQNVIEVGR